MANLIIQDTFDPYYAGRDDDARRTDRPRTAAKKKPEPESEIVLPEEVPAPASAIRRDRRPTAH